MTAEEDPGPRSVVMTIAVDGSMTVTLDGVAVPSDPEPWARESFAAILDQVTHHHRQAAVVEVRESDGSVFTDRIPAIKPRSPVAACSGTPVAADGFLPGERVAVAVVTQHLTAAPDGTVHACPPPDGSLGLLFVGRRSVTLHVVDG